MKHLILKISQMSWNLIPFDCCTCNEFCAYIAKELELILKKGQLLDLGLSFSFIKRQFHGLDPNIISTNF